jgi:hypothetical protein
LNDGAGYWRDEEKAAKSVILRHRPVRKTWVKLRIMTDEQRKFILSPPPTRHYKPNTSAQPKRTNRWILLWHLYFVRTIWVANSFDKKKALRGGAIKDFSCLSRTFT